MKKQFYIIFVIYTLYGCNCPRYIDIDIYRFTDTNWSTQISDVLSIHSQEHFFVMTTDTMNYDSLIIAIEEINYNEMEEMVANSSSSGIIKLQQHYLYFSNSKQLDKIKNTGKQQKIKINNYENPFIVEHSAWYFLYSNVSNQMEFIGPNTFAFVCDSVSYQYVDFHKLENILLKKDMIIK